MREHGCQRRVIFAKVIDRFLQSFKQRVVGIFGTLQQFLNIDIEGAQEFASFFIHGFRVVKFVVQLFEQVGKFFLGDGVPRFLGIEFEGACLLYDLCLFNTRFPDPPVRSPHKSF